MTARLASPRVAATAAGACYIGAGNLVLVALVLGTRNISHIVLLIGLAGAADCAGVLIILMRGRITGLGAHMLVGTGTVFIALAVVAAGRSPSAVAVAGLFVFSAVISTFYFSTVGIVLHVVAAETACVLTLSVIGPFAPGPSVIVGGTVVLLGVMVAWLVRLAAAAETDPLTGLVNRRGLDRRLGEIATDARRQATPLSVAFIDIDGFKAVNDQRGRDVGDRVLLDTVAAWRRLLAPDQVLSREGGDEFALLLPDRAIGPAADLVDRLRAAVPDGLTASAGIAEWDPEESLSFLLSSAEVALNQAKRAGRNCSRQQAHTAAAVVRLRQGLSRNELRVYYQPVIDLATGRIDSTEALLRWQHPENGLMLPGLFLPVAEWSPVMIDIGRMVLMEACTQTVLWRAAGGPRTVAVNVSGQELLTPDYPDDVERILQRSGLPAEALVLEVTETSFDADSDKAADTLTRLRKLGVRIAVDDFGTGYSSLSRLAHLPVDVLKIDQSFIRDIPPGSSSAPVIQAIIILAKAFGLDVIAEGVETEHQADVLGALGCDHLQGFLYSRAVPAVQLGPPWTDPVGVSPPAQGAAPFRPSR